MTVESLKKEARRHEQREEWIKALDLYLQAIEAQAGEDEPDIALHNRVGDLQVRLSDLEGAVGNYERAIALYLNAELPNNAIAVCRKITRHDPERPSPFLRMGQIRAQQGFTVDSRQNFLTYAEMTQASGETQDAFRALEEFAGLVPSDVEIRLFLADQLVAKEQPEEAIHYLSEAYRVVAGQGDDDRASEILDRIHAVDPDHPIPAATEPGWEAKPESEVAASAVEAPDDPEIITFEGESPVEVATDQVRLDPETGGMADDQLPEEADGDGASWDVEGLEITRFGELSETGPSQEVEDGLVDGLEVTGLVEAEEERGELPVAEFEEDDGDDLEISGPEGEEMEDLPLIRYELEEPDAEAAEAEEEADEEVIVPALASEEGDEGTDPLSALRARVEREPTDADGWRLLGEELFLQGQGDDGWEAMERAYHAFAENDDPEKAMRVVRELLLRDPDRIDLRQRVVEYAHRTDERTLLVQAFLELADGLRARGESQKAQAVFEQVLELDPANLRANEALSGGPPEVSGGDYVDLGAMVLDSQGEETTRWTVVAEEPTGDEEADFARMLSQFKEKVAENISGEDARSHYDLGAAYREMGLLHEAIAEFQQALRAEPGSLATFEMLGQCFLEKDEPEVAIRTLERGLELPTAVEDDLLGVYYCLGQAHEAVENSDSAREFYEKIFSLDINFKDVTERLKSLR